MDNTLRQLSQSLSELDSYDSDLRFMALNDIYNILHEDRTAHALASQRVLARVSNGVLHALQDQNTEVQNQAVKALSALVVIYDGEIRNIFSQLLQSESAVKDLAIRAVLTNVPKTTQNREIIISMILPIIQNNNEPSIDSTDVLLELVRGYGAGLSPENIDAIYSTTEKIAGNPSGLISKRAFDIYQELVPLASDEILQKIVAFATNLDSYSNRFKIGALSMLGNLINSQPSRFAGNNTFKDLALKYTEVIEEDNIEVVEASVALLRALVLHRLTMVPEFTERIAECIAYNPNLGDADDDDDMNEYSDFADSEVEDDFDDDNEDSWKVRRMAVRVVAAMVLGGDFSTAAEFAPQLMQVLATEPTDAVKQEILGCICLIADPPASPNRLRKHRNSDASMMAHDNVLTSHVTKIIQLAKLDTENPAYLPLIAKLYKNYDMPDTPAIIAICTKRIEAFKSQQILECLEVVKSILTYSTNFSNQEILPIIQSGLGQSLFKVQSLALENARLLNSLEVLPDIEKSISNGVSTTIRAASLETAAEILMSHVQDGPIDEFVQLATGVLQKDPEQRAATLLSLIALFRAGATVSGATLEQLTTQVLNLFSATAPSTTCSCLELIDLTFAPQMADTIAERTLQLPNVPEFIDLKCKTLGHAPAHPGVLDFALQVTKIKEYPTMKVPKKGSQQSPLITLYSAITKSVTNVLESVVGVYSESPIWADVIAEIIYTSDGPTPPQPSPITNWYVSVALQLTLRGRQVFTGEFDTTGINPILAGYCLGATAIRSDTAHEFLYTASTQIAEKPEVVLSAVEAIIMRADLSPDGVEKAWEAAELLTKQNFSQKDGMDILARIIGGLYVETNNTSRFSQWDNTLLGVDAAKAAFSLTKSEEQQVYLIRKFINGVSAPDINARSTAAKSLAWITQIQPTVVEPYTDEIMENALKSTLKDMSLVRLAQIGPYKHEIDDGLDFRKASYELIYLCLSNFGDISIADDIWVPVLQGLAEKEDHDIKMLTCLIIQLISEKDIRAIINHLTEITQLFGSIERMVVKETGIKIEHDKKATISRQIGICTAAIRENIKNAHVNDIKIQHLLTPTTR